MKDVAAIVLAAGRGVRFQSKIPKPLVLINARPLVTYSLAVFNAHPYIKEIVVVVSPKTRAGILKLVERYGFKKVRCVIPGGARRQDSVRNGLQHVSASSRIILIHDAARPFITAKLVSLLVQEAARSGAAIAGVPVKHTIKRVTGKGRFKVKETLRRDNLWEIQTPQVFKKEIILKAYEKFGDPDATDDAALVEKLGKRVNIVLGSYANIKLTTPEDLKVAEAIARNS